MNQTYYPLDPGSQNGRGKGKGARKSLGTRHYKATNELDNLEQGDNGSLPWLPECHFRCDLHGNLHAVQQGEGPQQLLLSR